MQQIALSFWPNKENQDSRIYQRAYRRISEEYAKEYHVWEYKALKYANDHKHGIPALIIKDIYYDKIWTKDFPKEN